MIRFLKLNLSDPLLLFLTFFNPIKAKQSLAAREIHRE